MSIKNKMLIFVLLLFTAFGLIGATATYRIYQIGDAVFSSAQNYSLLILQLAAAGVFFVMTLAVGANGIFLVNSVLSPLKKLSQMMSELKEGNLDVSYSYHAKDEFGEMFQEFDDMRRRLKLSLLQQQEQEERRKEMVANIAHDIKTPITSICGYAEGLADGVADTPEKQEKYLRIIREKSQAVDKLTEDLLLFSKLDLQQVPFEARILPVRAFLESACEDLLAAVEYRLTVTTDGSICIDPFQMGRVLQNIFENSGKYGNAGDAGGLALQTEAYENEHSIIIKITDNGAGLSAEECDKIFDRFYRVDASRSKRGSGLGLSISKQIVEGMGGKIWAKSAEGCGLSIYISYEKAGVQ